MLLDLHSRVVGKVHLIQCKGRLIIGEEAKALEATLEQDSRRHLTQVVLEVSGVTRLDSIGLGLIVRYSTQLRKRGGDLRVAAPSALFTQLLEMTHVAHVIRTFSTEDEAIASFGAERRGPASGATAGAPILVVDSSGDFCAFVRAVLSQHGYQVKSSGGLSDARVLLRVEKPAHILVGPGNAKPDATAASLRTLCPDSQVLQLDAEFKTRDAHEASDILLRLLGTVAP